MSHDRSKRAPALVGALALAAMTYALQQALVVPALPELQRQLGASDVAVGWVVTAYLLSACVATPLAARLGEVHGRRRVLLCVLAVLAAGTVLAAVAASLAVLVAGRVLQGAGGGIFPLAYAILRAELGRDGASGAIALISSLLGVGGGAGVVVAGVIADRVDPAWIFWAQLPVIAVAALAIVVAVPRGRAPAGGPVSWLSAALAACGLSAVLLAISGAARHGWLAPRTLLLAAAGTAVLALWARRELGAPHPLIDVAMLRERGVALANAAAVMLGAGMYISFVLVPQLAQEPRAAGYGLGASATAAGALLVPMTLAILVVGLATGRLERRVGSRPPLLAGIAVCLAGLVLLAVAHRSAASIAAGSAVVGVGIGLSYAAMANLVVARVRLEQTAVATGVNTVMRLAGGTLGAQVAATILASQQGAAGAPAERAYTLAFLAGGAALALALAAGVAIPAPREAR